MFEHEDALDLPNGANIRRKSVTTVVGPEDCGPNTCVRIRATHQNADAEDVEGPQAEISGTVNRLINPSTMLIYEESMERTIKMTADVPTIGPTTMEMHETREYEYQY